MLRTCRQVTSKEAKGPVGLCTNIANMCVQFQIVCNGYARERIGQLIFLVIVNDKQGKYFSVDKALGTRQIFCYG